MKREYHTNKILSSVAVLAVCAIGLFTVTSKANAQMTDITCVETFPTNNSTTWPLGLNSVACGDTKFQGAMQDVLADLASNGKPYNSLLVQHGLPVYDFESADVYTAAAFLIPPPTNGPSSYYTGTIKSNQRGLTWVPPSGPANSNVFEVGSGGEKFFNIQNSTAHEVGHQVDYLLAQNPTFDYDDVTFGGTLTKGDKIGITITDSRLPGGSKSYPVSVGANSTFTSISRALTTLINSDSALQGFGISAQAVKNGLVLVANPQTRTAFSGTATGAPPTETISVAPTLSSITRFSDGELFQAAFAVDLSIKSARPCNVYGQDDNGFGGYIAGVLTGVTDENGDQICVSDASGAESLAGRFAGMNALEVETTIYKAAKRFTTDSSEAFPEEFAQSAGYFDYTLTEGPNAGNPNGPNNTHSKDEPFRQSFFLGCTQRVTYAATVDPTSSLNGLAYVEPVADGSNKIIEHYCDGTVVHATSAVAAIAR